MFFRKESFYCNIIKRDQDVESRKILFRRESFYCNIKRRNQDKMMLNQKKIFFEKNLFIATLKDVNKKETFCCNIKKRDQDVEPRKILFRKTSFYYNIKRRDQDKMMLNHKNSFSKKNFLLQH
jgi:hypothetical protein